MIHKPLLASLIVLIISINVYSQSVEWLITPQYSSIEYLGPEMFKVTTQGKEGIVTIEGKPILKPEYDFISDFYEGKSIFGNVGTNRILLGGYVTEEGDVVYASGKYYLSEDYPFYSEGFLPVKDSRGFNGYLDEQCEPVFPFTKDEVRPFSGGCAAVGNGDNFHWLTDSGDKIFLRLDNGGIAFGGTNFYDGKAYLWDEEGNFFILNDDGKMSRIPSRDLYVDYLHRADTGLDEEVIYQKYLPEFDETWEPTEKNGKYSYLNSSGELLVPYQYESVGRFSDGIAKAESNGKWGLLKIVEDKESFSTKPSKTRFIFSPGTACECEFQLSVPEKWRTVPVSVLVKEAESGKQLDLKENINNSYTFFYSPIKNKEKKRFLIDVYTDDTRLWTGEEVYDFEERVKLKTSLRIVNVDADSNNRCVVTAIISNPSSIAVTTTVNLKGGGSKSVFDNRTVKLTIPPHGSKTVSSSFLVKKVELDGWCSVTTSDGSSSNKSGFELKPF